MAWTKTGFQWIKTLSGGPPQMLHMNFVSGTYYQGEPLRISGTTGSCAALRAAATAIFGVCAAYVTTASSTTTKIPVYIGNTDNVFECKVPGISLTPHKCMGTFLDATSTTGNYRLGTGTTLQWRVVGYHPDESTSAHTGAKMWVVAAKNIMTAEVRSVRRTA